MELIHSGKVRDVYTDGGDVVLVASDRVSVYDVVLPTPVPDKGALLTQLSAWWFETLGDVVPHHMLSVDDVPEPVRGRAMRCRALEMIGVECIVRGHLAGSGLAEYRRTGTISGVALPPGLAEGSRLPEPVFTPTTKAALGAHDEFITFDDVVAQVGADVAATLRDRSLELYRRAAPVAERSGIILADTKFEFGHDRAGVLRVGDEILTSDSSRFWPADGWEPGRPQFSFDKQYVRDWATGTGWDKQPPAPEVPAEVVAVTRDRYVQLYERITGRTWQPPT